MFLRSKNILVIGLLAFVAGGTMAHAASTNPWAMPQTQTQPQANLQGGLNMGGGFTFGGGAQVGQGMISPAPQFVAPQPKMPQQFAPQKVVPQQAVPQAGQQQFGVYPPLSNNNASTTLSSPNSQPQTQQVRPQGQQYWQGQQRGAGQMNFGFNPGSFGFPGFGGFNNFGFGFNGGFNGGYGNSLGNGFGFVAPGPVYPPGYGSPYSQGYGAQQYQWRPKGK